LIATGLPVLPGAALAIALDRRYLEGAWSGWVLGCALAAPLLLAFAVAIFRMRSSLGSAIALDEEADLKDRISTALEFLAQPERLDEPRTLQIEDAILHAERLNLRPLFRLRFPRYAMLVPVFAAALLLSFLVPPRLNPLSMEEAAAALQKDRQLDELHALRDELEQFQNEEEEISDVLKKLAEIERRFDEGAIEERDMLIELARLDEQLRDKLAQLGAENLQSELGTIAPHMAASQASRAAAQALKENDFDKAAEEMEKLAEKMKEGALSEEQKDEMARNMSVAASKLGKDGQNSFTGDLSAASEALQKGDSASFERSSKNMGNKFQRLAAFKKLNRSRQSIALCKACLGQPKSCSTCNGQGCSACNNPGNKKGGLKAGAGNADPLGDPNRLADSYKQMLRVTGMAGAGPVESEVEVTEGQTSESQLEARDLYAEYAAVAEQAIEREDIPLSHRYHVKRYFQSIRPAE